MRRLEVEIFKIVDVNNISTTDNFTDLRSRPVGRQVMMTRLTVLGFRDWTTAPDWTLAGFCFAFLNLLALKNVFRSSVKLPV